MDTVIIKIYGPHKFHLSNWSLFLPELIRRTYGDLTPTERTSTRSHLRKFILHTKKTDRYLPNVEVIEALTPDRKDIRYILKIEFSAPKLLYWNSLQEVGENDMEAILSALKAVLRSVGITTQTGALENATLTAIHACKNIPLPKNIRMREIINDLTKIDISKVFDVSDKQTKMGARVLNIYSGTIEWSFYNKISDSLRPKNKRTDKKRINPERAIVEHYGLQDREVFRYEYRIKKNQTIRREINSLLKRDGKTPVVFKDLFTPNLMKNLTLNSWHMIIKRPENQLSLFRNIDKLGLFLHILSEAKKLGEKGHSLNNALISYGLATAIRDHGAKEVRGAIFDLWNTDHPERLTNKIKLASDLTKELPYSGNIIFIDEALERYELITLTSLENGL